MPRLLTIRTDLSEYKTPQYGYDRRGAGPRNTNASGQPYEIENLPRRSFSIEDFGSGVPNKMAEDFLLRGGQLLPERVITDTSRLFKMFTDLKSPRGLLFTGKQEVLSRTGVNIKAQSGTPNTKESNKLPFNDGIYLPTSTLAQAAVNPLGGHLLKQGINPFFDTSEAAARGNVGGIFNFLTSIELPLSQPIYFNTVAFDERKTNVTGSRLIQFLENNIDRQTDSNDLYSYSGGPGSIVGVGKTTIRALADQRTGFNNPQLIDSKFFSTGKSKNTDFGFNFGVFKGGLTNPNFETFRGGTYFGNIEASGSKTVTGRYASITQTPVSNLLNSKFKITNDERNGAQMSLVGQSVFQSGSFQANNPGVTGLGTSLDYKSLMSSKGTNNVVVGSNNNDYPQAQIIQDFRTNTPTPSVGAPSYTSVKRYETRVNLGDAGSKNASTSYTTGRDYGSKEALDQINALQLYQSSDADLTKPINDLCKFRIGVINNDDPNLKTYIHFRAFLDNMSDAYSADWGEQKYSGRAETLYNYQGFNRTFSLGWTVVAQSKQELMPMYQKLNYLASACAPDYSKDGYMRGNLIELTVGGYLHNQVGIMKSINYTIPMESPWEIAINDAGDSDSSVKELPFMIQVEGFEFIPIHNFVPNKQKNLYGIGDTVGAGVEGDLAVFGDEQYISLDNGITNGYINYISKNITRNLNENINQNQNSEQSTPFSDATNIDDIVNNPLVS